MAKTERATMEEMVQFGLQRVLESFGKGQNLNDSMYSIILHAAHWGAENREAILKLNGRLK